MGTITVSEHLSTHLVPILFPQIMFTRELNKRLADADIHNVTALALHPGMVLTNVVRSLPALVQTAYKAALSALLLSPSQGEQRLVHSRELLRVAEPVLVLTFGCIDQARFEYNCTRGESDRSSGVSLTPLVRRDR